ncbi:hypothetical protein MBLNU230_g2570t1 [Neophaeotheca triangularis]
MAPIRRYLRITKYSVLEVRIYLDKPSDISWLLSPSANVLPRIINEIRPKVLPKLREENENAKRKGTGKKKKGIKDVATGEDFEVAIFLKETSTRHSLLTKRKEFAGEGKRLKGNGKGLAGWLNKGSEGPIVVDDDEVPEVLREESGEKPMDEIPEMGDENVAGGKRKAGADGDEDALFVSSSDEEFFQTQRESRANKRQKRAKGSETAPAEPEPEPEDDKKKLGMNTSYDGFSIYGRILCLIVKRTGKKTAPAGAPAGGSQMMEQWVSTQVAQEAGIVDDDEG